MSIILWCDISQSLSGYLHIFKNIEYTIYYGDDLPEYGPVLVLGNKPLYLLQKKGIVAKKRTIQSFHDKIVEYNAVPFLITYHPQDIEKNYEAKFSIICAIKQAQRYINTGIFDPAPIQTEWVSTLGPFIQQMGEWVSLDLETQGLDPFNPENYIICLTLSSKGYTCGVYINGSLSSLIFKELRALLLMSTVKLQGANLKYDLLWLKVKYGLECTNFTFDTTLVGSLLDENRSNSLKMHGALFTPYGGWDLTSDKSQMSEVPKDKLLVYGSYDVFVQELVAERFRKDLKEEELHIRKNHKQYGPMNFYQKLLHPVARVFEKIEYRGIEVDLEYLNSLKTQVEKEVEQESQQALSLVPKALQRKYKDNLSVTRAVLLENFLFTDQGLNLKPLVVTKKSGKPSTSYDDHLYKFKDDSKAGEFLKHLKRYSELQKILSTYIDGFKVHIRSDGKFHPSVILHRGEFQGGKSGGTVSGRIGWSNPSMMVIPSHTPDADRIRRMFIAPPGYIIVGADLSQAELRLVAHTTQDPIMMQAFKDGKDLHKVTAYNTLKITEQEFYELPIEQQKHYRQVAKSQNFGLVYVMGSFGLQSYAEKSYGVVFSLEDAEKYYDSFHNTYKKIKPWHKQCIKLAYEYGYRVSLLGRVRHLPQIYSADKQTQKRAERRAINSTIQGDASDMNLLAVSEISKDRKILPFCTIHDSIYSYVPESYIDVAAKKIKETMEHLPLEQFGCILDVPIVVDIKVGNNLGDLHDI